MTAAPTEPTWARADFTVMVKPVGSACNMRCGYCYYLHTPGSDAHGVMSRETLRAFIRNYIAAAPGPTVTFTWHGGEPMLAGLDFYREAVAIQKEYLPEGWSCWNNLQTNGVLLDEAWCRFLAEEHFDVGLSVDGTQLLHDRQRPDAAGQPTYAQIVQGLRRLQAHGIQPDLLCTVTSATAENGRAVYEALRDLGTGWMQFIPILVRDENGELTKESVRPEAYGRFLREVFAAWLYHDLEQCEVQLFSEMSMILAGGAPKLCWMQESCGRALVVEKDGSVFACDHFVRPDYRIGSVETDRLAALVDSAEQTAFGQRKATGLTASCRACPYLALCHGGCLKDRFGLSPDGEPGQYALCEGLRFFFDYAVPRLRAAMGLASQGHSRPEIMRRLTEAERERYRHAERNALCPCGSGRKFKQCCQRLVP